MYAQLYAAECRLPVDGTGQPQEQCHVLSARKKTKKHTGLTHRKYLSGLSGSWSVNAYQVTIVSLVFQFFRAESLMTSDGILGLCVSWFFFSVFTELVFCRFFVAALRGVYLLLWSGGPTDS